MELLGRYSKHTRSLEKFQELLELVPSGGPPAPRKARQTQRRLREPEVEELVAGYLAGSTAYELAGQFGVHRNTVLGILERRGVPRRYQKLSPEQLDLACTLYRGGLSLTKVGSRLGRRAETVRQALMKADLMGRLSNPPKTLEHLSEQGCHGSPRTSRETLKSPKRSSDSPGPRDSNNKGQLSNPAPMAPCADEDGANPPTAGRSTRRLGPPVQRRLTPSQLEAVAARYQSGRSLNDLAREFGVHHRTVADHLERLGIARRVTLPKLSAADVKGAATRYRAAESLAIVARP